MKIFILPAVAGALLLTGCAGVKSDFDCDATTSDRCMTMSQANQLARDKTGSDAPGKPAAGAARSPAELPRTVPVVSSHNVPAQSLPTTTPPAITSAPSAPVSTEASVNTFSCNTVRCDGAGSVRALRAGEQIATVWVAPWIDSSDAFHQPGRISFVTSGPAWVMPARIN
ncbi:type IV conjugative transfer system lipoprotein TraV [Lelliottia nimipressuralis]|uniref:Type IV conjugative transfer system lipoprotein TraV n=1 Tax=Lelliottia nimipressuralis TaxID=69220 RepID=A0ABD4KIJ4_9ENTR|nr:type IV conjugative transfer system lipoprotein TraV [Lelliottia nimipressuralis]MBF4180384.1 type IV conjugative transfer system lipoprotein TraV [Lelliottia nimipressuralis]